MSGKSLSRRRSTGASLIRSILCSEFDCARTSSMTASCGMAKRSPPASTISAETIASVSGILMTKVEPWPSVDFTSIVPPIWSMLVRTTSMPTPRPETLVTVVAVEKPGAKMNLWICASVIFSAAASVTTRLAIAFSLILAVLRPRPSSPISMTICPPS